MDPLLLEDLDYPNDLALRSRTNSNIHDKARWLNVLVKQLGLIISNTKTDLIALKTSNRRLVQVENEELPYTDKFPLKKKFFTKNVQVLVNSCKNHGSTNGCHVLITK